jgi:hypothetical protein
MNQVKGQIREVLGKFQDGYTARDVSQLDKFMELFQQSDEIEMIGVGASKRGGNEWFQGFEQIREIIESDWTYWGDVKLNVEGAKISVKGDAAWLSTDGDLLNTAEFDDALPLYLDMMKETLDDESRSLKLRVMDATFFGLSRIRDIQRGVGFPNSFTFTAVLVCEDNVWRFHTIHWSFPGE